MFNRIHVKVCTRLAADVPCRVAVCAFTLLGVLAAKRSDSDTVKTTVELPGELWRAAKIRAMDERADLRTVLIRALEDYLREEQPERPAQT
jgi:hypothetical protein